jgi:oligopeptidase B
MRASLFRKLGKRICVVFFLTMLTAADKPAPPVAKAVPKTTNLHGDTRVDPYFWLRDRGNPEVIRYLEEENRYTEAVMKSTEPLQQKLYEEMLGRIQETDLSVPEKLDDYEYYSRTEKGRQYPIHCRKPAGAQGPEEILLDVNGLAEGHKFFSIGVYKVSPSHKLLAYSTDTEGSNVFTLQVKDLATSALLAERIPNTAASVAWANDNRTLFYTTLDSAKRSHRLYRHALGTDAAADVLVYEEPDQRFSVELSKTRSKQYLLLTLESHTTTEVRYLNAGEPRGEFRTLKPRAADVEYYVDHHGDAFYIRINDQGKNFRLMKTLISDANPGKWMELIPHRQQVSLDDIDAFRDHLVITERDNGLKRLRVLHLASGREHYVEFPEPVYTFFAGSNPEFHTSRLRFTYMSLVTPRSVFDYDMDARTRVLKKQFEVLGGYDPAQYSSERLMARAPDGTGIPISLVYRKGMVKNGRNPLYLYGYGSYGLSTDPAFSSDRISLLDRGFIFAIAHIRGGGDVNRYWYEEGKLLKKKNTFRDFIACAEYLIAQKYTSPDKLVISGGSAGGLLVGAVANMRPDLMRVVIAKVPFVDVINTMLDTSLPLTVTEFEEWGNPQKQEFYEYMKSYAPYENVEPKKYPHMLLTGSLNDSSVPYWEPAKWAAKLRALKKDGNLLLLKINLSAGHGGVSGRYERLKETASEYAFILDRMGM